MVIETIGERAGKQGRLLIGTSAALFDSSQQRILLQRRADNKKWAVPGGAMEPGESFIEACAREVLEETGLHIRVQRLVGVYTNPHYLVEYPDGNRWQISVLHFEAEAIGGNLALGEETIDLEYFSLSESAALDMHPLDRLRLADSFARREQALIHNVW